MVKCLLHGMYRMKREIEEPKKRKNKYEIQINEYDDIKKINDSTQQIYWNLPNIYCLSSIFCNLPESVHTLEICNGFSEKMIIPEQIKTVIFKRKTGFCCSQNDQIIVPPHTIVNGCKKKYVLKGDYKKMSNDEKLAFLIKNNAYDFEDEIIELFNQKLKPNQENLYSTIKNENDKHFELCIEYGCMLNDKAFQLACRKKYAKVINICLKNGFQITENEINLIIPTKNK